MEESVQYRAIKLFVLAKGPVITERGVTVPIVRPWTVPVLYGTSVSPIHWIQEYLTVYVSTIIANAPQITAKTMVGVKLSEIPSEMLTLYVIAKQAFSVNNVKVSVIPAPVKMAERYKNFRLQISK